MSVIDDLLAANAEGAADLATTLGPQPSRRLALVTCMDARIDPLAVFGLRPGEVHVVRNAGGRVTADVLRSLALSTAVLGADAVVVMQHTGCGLAGVSDEELKERTGADLEFLPIGDHAATLRLDVELLAATPFLSGLRSVAGFLYHVETGGIDDVVRWERPN